MKLVNFTYLIGIAARILVGPIGGALRVLLLLHVLLFHLVDLVALMAGIKLIWFDMLVLMILVDHLGDGSDCSSLLY